MVRTAALPYLRPAGINGKSKKAALHHGELLSWQDCFSHEEQLEILQKFSININEKIESIFFQTRSEFTPVGPVYPVLQVLRRQPARRHRRLLYPLRSSACLPSRNGLSWPCRAKPCPDGKSLAACAADSR